MNVLVTGANGLLGRELCVALASDHSVTALTHTPVLDPIPNVEYRTVDLSKQVNISQLPNSIDVVFHLAQSSRFREFPDGTKDTFDVNTRSTLELLEYCRTAGGKQFFLASTGGVYGGQNTPISEAGALIPPSEIGFYFASKLASEMFSSTYRQVFSVTVLRFFFMYGARQRSDMFLPRLVHSVLNGLPITISETGGIRVNPILASDVATLLRDMIGQVLPHVINVGGPDIFSIREIATMIGDRVGKAPTWKFAASGVDVVADISTLGSYTNLEDLTAFTTGLGSLIDSILESRVR